MSKNRVLYLMWHLEFYIPLLQYKCSFLGAGAASFSFFHGTHAPTHTLFPQTTVPNDPTKWLDAWKPKTCGCPVICHRMIVTQLPQNTFPFFLNIPMQTYNPETPVQFRSFFSGSHKFAAVHGTTIGTVACLTQWIFMMN